MWLPKGQVDSSRQMPVAMVRKDGLFFCGGFNVKPCYNLAYGDTSWKTHPTLEMTTPRIEITNRP